MGGKWRVGKRVGQSLYQIKEAPGWRVAHEVSTLFDAATWLTERGVDINLVPVLINWPWRSLGEHLKGGESQP